MCDLAAAKFCEALVSKAKYFRRMVNKAAHDSASLLTVEPNASRPTHDTTGKETLAALDVRFAHWAAYAVHVLAARDEVSARLSQW